MKDIEISFSVDEKNYSKFKASCKRKGITPAIVLKRYMAEYIAQNRAAYKLLSWNVCCGSKEALDELQYRGTEDERMLSIAEEIVQSEVDAAYICEFAPLKGGKLIESLEAAGYTIVYPKTYEAEKAKRLRAMNILAVKNNVTFVQESLECSLSMRYIMGTLKKKNEKPIRILGIHVPQVSDEQNLRQMERKTEMLNLVITYIDKCKSQKFAAVAIGDFNCELVNNSVRGDLFNRITSSWCDTGVGNMRTFKNRATLDYCFASDEMYEDYKTVMTKSEDFKQNLSDHKALITEII